VNSSLAAALIRFRGERERIVCAPHPDIDWPTVMTDRQVVYFSLGAMVDRQLAEGFSRALIEDLTAFIGACYARSGDAQRLYLLCDEIASMITPGFVDLLNKSRGQGLRCIVLGQSLVDLEAALGSRARAQQVLANLNTVLQLRTPLAEDARSFAQRTGRWRLIERSHGTSQGGGLFGRAPTAAQNASCHLVEREPVPPAAIQNLPVGHAFVSGMGVLGIVAFPLLGVDVAPPVPGPAPGPGP
jgi:hypothetical protein